MAWPEDDIVLISALEHYSYCPRQCARIHVEKVFDENIFTIRGRNAHERVDEPEQALERGVVVERGMPLWSERYGLQGKADLVEFRPDGSVYPVEYKFGKRRAKQHDALQLCAQALCLEEMLRRNVERGAIYHVSSHARREVDMTDALRAETLKTVDAVRAMLHAPGLPSPADDARCENCSLVDACQPEALCASARPRGSGNLFAPIPEDEFR